MSRVRTGAFVASALLTAASAIGQSPKTPPIDMLGLLARVGERVAAYYERAQSIMCTETMMFQTFGNSLVDPYARTLTYDLRVSWEKADSNNPKDPSVLRTLKTVNGKAPKAGDEPRCLDPKPISLDPLQFVLPQHQAEYKFTYKGIGRTADGHSAVMIDYVPLSKAPPEFKWTDTCFSVDAPARTTGRLFVDRFDGDILQIDETLAGPIDVPLPEKERKTSNLAFITLDRSETSIRYRTVTFTDPNEIVLLPETSEQMTVLRTGGPARQKTTHKFTGYQRFVTSGKVVEP
jgi:hypothetical protein